MGLIAMVRGWRLHEVMFCYVPMWNHLMVAWFRVSKIEMRMLDSISGEGMGGGEW